MTCPPQRPRLYNVSTNTETRGMRKQESAAAPPPTYSGTLEEIAETFDRMADTERRISLRVATHSAAERNQAKGAQRAYANAAAILRKTLIVS